jgi:hypothetical protein
MSRQGGAFWILRAPEDPVHATRRGHPGAYFLVGVGPVYVRDRHLRRITHVNETELIEKKPLQLRLVA